MKTIFQLAKIARRIPRIKARALKRLISKKKLSPGARAYEHARLSGAHQAAQLLKQELVNRNITGKPFKDARNPQHRRWEAFKAMIASANASLGADADRVFKRHPLLAALAGQRIVGSLEA